MLWWIIEVFAFWCHLTLTFDLGRHSSVILVASGRAEHRICASSNYVLLSVFIYSRKLQHDECTAYCRCNRFGDRLQRVYSTYNCCSCSDCANLSQLGRDHWSQCPTRVTRLNSTQKVASLRSVVEFWALFRTSRHNWRFLSSWVELSCGPAMWTYTFLTRLIFRTVFALALTTWQWLTKPNF